MSTPDRPESTPVDADAINVTPGLEEKLTLFWERNSKLIVALCVVVLLVIVGRGVLNYLEAQKEITVQSDYAAAQTTEQLTAFAKANDGNALAGVAWLQVADTAYANEEGTAAVEAYQNAINELSAGTLADRATLGLAMSQIQAGQSAEGEASLKALVDTETVVDGVRTEAAYHLASLAHAAGKSDEVKGYADQIMTIDPSSPWAQRAMSLQMAEKTETEASDVVSSSDADAAESADSVIKLKLEDN